MKVRQIYTNNSLRNFTYIIEFSDNRAICIDPFYAEQVLAYLKDQSLELEAIINTHEHHDHVAGNKRLVNVTECEVWAHENAKGKIVGVDRFLKKGEVIELDGDSYLEILDTPGHTFAHLCIKLISNGRVKAVFTGDTLFNAGVGNCHNGGDPTVLYESVSKQLATLDDEVKIYPGHDYWRNNLGFTKSVESSNKDADFYMKRYLDELAEGNFLVSNIGIEKKINAFLRLDSTEIKKKVGVDTPKEVFLKLRELRNNW